jgi:hypothetical protein
LGFSPSQLFGRQAARAHRWRISRQAGGTRKLFVDVFDRELVQHSVSTRKDWGMMVPAFIMTVPAFMVPDNRVSPYVEDPAVNEKSASRACEVIEIHSGFAVPSRPVAS